MTHAPRRVVITGVGAVTPLGIGREALWDGLHAKRSAVRTITRFDPSPFRTHIAAEIDGFDPADHMDAKRVKRLDRFGHFVVAAARMAADDAALDLPREDRTRVGAMLGTALGGVGYAEEQLGNYLTGGLRAVDTLLALSVFGGSASCNVAIEFGLSGPNSTNAMSCASGTMAIGAAVLVLEERNRAVSRGAPILAEITGYGTTNDGHHMTAPHPDGHEAARAMRLAIADARIAVHEVDYVNAHASATPLNDPAETAAIRAALGSHADRVPVSGTKGFHGHALGATGAWEAAICAMSLARGWIPPTLNLDAPDALCGLDCVPGQGRPLDAEIAISNSFGFGGINACLVLRRDDGRAQLRS